MLFKYDHSFPWSSSNNNLVSVKETRSLHGQIRLVWRQNPLSLPADAGVATSCWECERLPMEVGVQRPLFKMLFINKQWQTQVLWPHGASDLRSNRKRSAASDYKCIRTAGAQTCTANSNAEQPVTDTLEMPLSQSTVTGHSVCQSAERIQDQEVLLDCTALI